jgi:carbonic anhydrase
MNSLLLSCADGRITQSLQKLLHRLEAEDADRLRVPGGPLVLTRPGMERRVVTDFIKTQVEAHTVKRILLVSHQDCSVYQRALGGLGFDQQELLERDLHRVKMLLENDYPDIEVNCFVIPWRENGAGEASFGEAEPVL